METSNLNLWSPDPGDDYALTQDLAAMADDIDQAITETRAASMRVPVANQAERDNLAKFEGLTAYREDTNRDERWNGSRWVLQPGVETRRLDIGRSSVPPGSTDYVMVPTGENVAFRSDAYFNVTWNANTGTILLDPGFYLLAAFVYIDWAGGGPGARVYLSDATNPNLPFAQANFGEGQFLSINTPFLTDGTTQFMVWGNHNSGATRNLYGRLDIIRLRGF